MFMTIDGLKKLHDTRPFRPFVMHMTDGRQIHVKEPEILARSPNGRMAAVYTRGDSFALIDLSHVMSISVGSVKGKIRRPDRGQPS